MCRQLILASKYEIFALHCYSSKIETKLEYSKYMSYYSMSD